MCFVKKIFRKEEGLLAKEIDGELLIIPGKGKDLSKVYYLDNDVSFHIWKALDGKKMVADIEDEVIREFDVSYEVLTHDLREFLTKLSQVGAIR